MRVIMTALATLSLAACASNEPAYVVGPSPPPARDELYRPSSVHDGKLQYARDRKPFAPIMTEKADYPTQEQAQYALERSQWRTVYDGLVRKSGYYQTQVYEPSSEAAGLRLFACKPGGLDGDIGRTLRVKAKVVVCATDLLGPDGEALARVPLNFWYSQGAWRVQDPEPGYVPPRFARN